MSKKRLNILHTESMGIRGGQPMRVIEELKIIKELGYTPHLACRANTWLEAEAKKHQIKVVNAPLKRAVDFKSVSILFNYMRKNSIDITHSHNSKDSYSAFVASKLLKIPFIRARHSDLKKRPGPICNLADSIVVTGKKIERDLINYKIEPSKIISIPSYPDKLKFKPNDRIREELRAKFGIRDNQIVIGSLAGYKPSKRPHWVVDALYNLKDKYQDIIFLLAGSDGRDYYKEEFNKRLKELKLEDRVKFLGYVDASRFLNAIDIYICASEREGVPQALMQSMLMGKAVISTDVGGIFDLNRENNLILIEPNSKESLTKELNLLLSNPERVKELSKLNRALALKYFNRDILKDELNRLYQRLAK